MRLAARSVLEHWAIAAAGAAALATGAFAALAAPGLSVVLALLMLALVIGVAASSAGVTKRFFRSLGVADDLGSVTTLCFLCLAVITSSWNGVRASSGLAVCDVFFVLTAASFVVTYLLGRPVVSVVPRWLSLPAYALLIDVLVSALAGGGSLSSMVPGLRLVAALFLTPLVLGLTAGNLRALWLIVDCWLLSAGVNATIASFDYLSGAHLGEGITGVLSPIRESGLTTQPNHLGFVCVFALPFFVARLLGASGRRRQGIYLGGMFLCLMALLSSGSRGALVVGVFALASAPFFQAAVLRRALKLLALVVAIGAIAVVLFPSNLSFVSIERLLGTAGADVSVERSDAERVEKREEAIRNFNAEPVYGTGFSSILEAFSVYLQLLSAGGVIALISWLGFALGGLRSSFRLSRDKAAPIGLRNLGGAAAGTFAAWMLLGAVENQLYDRYLFVPAGIVVACLVYRVLERAPATVRSYIASTATA